MLYRIICRNKERTCGYAEPVRDVRPVPETARSFFPDAVFYIDPKGEEWTCSAADIVENPDIVSWFLVNICCKVRLGGVR